VSFRATVFWGVTLAVIAMVAVEAVLDIAIDAVADHAHVEAARRVDAALDHVEATLDVTTLRPEAVVHFTTPDGRALLARLVTEGSAPAELPTPSRRVLDLVGPGWVVGSRLLPSGGRVELALAQAPAERVLANRLLLDLVDIPVFLALAFATASLLSRRVASPLRALDAATGDLAGQRFPRPVPVPPGDDELARLARSFNAMSEAVRRYVERERTFTRYASHELRNPLAALKVQVERAQLGTVDAAVVLPSLERNVRRLEDVIEALHGLTQYGEREIRAVPVEAVVRDSLAALSPETRERVSVARLPPGVLVTDGTLLRQALHNLLDNALRYGSGPATVTVHAQDVALTLRVCDVGPGVPPEVVERLTEPFYRANPNRRDGGLGLGLALVEVIAQSLDGELDMRNTGSGLEATLRLPIVAVG
jgi:signal transduction histidine kinase